MKMITRKPISLFLALAAGLVLSSCGKGGGGGDAPAPVPVIKVEDASVTRTPTDGTLRFRITLNKTTTVPVTVDYSLSNGSALSGTDYVTTSGTATFTAGQTLVEVPVTVKGDPTDTRRNNLDFTVTLANPQAGALGVLSAKGIIVSENGTNLPTDNTGYTTPTSYPGYTLAWSDEFNGNALDLSAWNTEIGNGSGGWGNNELEYYTNSPKNVFQSNGNLIIEARKEAIGGQNYSSARLTTQGKKNFQYGRMDIRAKLPVSKGMWPALWMLGSNINTVPWPSCGEIDIMELIGVNPNTTHGTMHWKPVSGVSMNRGDAYTLGSGDFSQEFHVFTIIWSEDMIKWLVDDNLFLTTTRSDVGAANYPFNAPQFFIFNVAVGGNWPGPPDGSTPFPQRMFVDYVRVFQ